MSFILSRNDVKSYLDLHKPVSTIVRAHNYSYSGLTQAELSKLIVSQDDECVIVVYCRNKCIFPNLNGRGVSITSTTYDLKDIRQAMCNCVKIPNAKFEYTVKRYGKFSHNLDSSIDSLYSSDTFLPMLTPFIKESPMVDVTVPYNLLLLSAPDYVKHMFNDIEKQITDPKHVVDTCQLFAPLNVTSRIHLKILVEAFEGLYAMSIMYDESLHLDEECTTLVECIINVLMRAEIYDISPDTWTNMSKDFNVDLHSLSLRCLLGSTYTPMVICAGTNMLRAGDVCTHGSDRLTYDIIREHIELCGKPIVPDFIDVDFDEDNCLLDRAHTSFIGEHEFLIGTINLNILNMLYVDADKRLDNGYKNSMIFTFMSRMLRPDPIEFLTFVNSDITKSHTGQYLRVSGSLKRNLYIKYLESVYMDSDYKNFGVKCDNLNIAAGL